MKIGATGYGAPIGTMLTPTFGEKQRYQENQTKLESVSLKWNGHTLQHSFHDGGIDVDRRRRSHFQLIALVKTYKKKSR